MRAALAISPSNQPCLHYFLVVQGVGTEACINCGRIKTYTFKNSPRFASGFSANISSEEHEMVWTICRGARSFTSVDVYRVWGCPHALTSHLLVQYTVSLSGHRESCGRLGRLRLWLGLCRYLSNHPKSVLGILHKLQGHKWNV